MFLNYEIIISEGTMDLKLGLSLMELYTERMSKKLGD